MCILFLPSVIQNLKQLQGCLFNKIAQEMKSHDYGESDLEFEAL